MEVVPSSGDTSAHEFAVVLEIHGKKTRAVFHITDLPYSVMHIDTLFLRGKKLYGSVVPNRHIVEVQRITASLLHQHINKFITGNALDILACIADGSSEHKTVLLQKIHGVHHLAVNSLASAEVVDFRFSFQAEGQEKIPHLLHLPAQFLIHQRTVCVGEKYAVVMLSAQLNDIFFADHGLAAGEHIEINAQFFSLGDHRIHLFKGKVQLVSVFRRPASCAVQITCAGWIHQNDPGNVAVVDLSHLADRLRSVVKSLVPQIQKRGLQNVGMEFIYHPGHIMVQGTFRITGDFMEIIPVYAYIKFTYIFLGRIHNI